jgi:hypothetical protein
MEFDRILVDILDWIRRSLWWRRRQRRLSKPYEILKSSRGKLGLLKLVERDTPRAVRTWVFTPYRTGEPKKDALIQDVHLCLDHLYPLDGEKKGGDLDQKQFKYRGLVLTHKVTFLKASHFLNKDGSYNGSTIFCEGYDFLGSSPHQMRDRYAVPTLDDIAAQLKEFPPASFDWQFEVEAGRKRHMGRYWTPIAGPSPYREEIKNHPAVGKYCLIAPNSHPIASNRVGSLATVCNAWKVPGGVVFSVAAIDGEIFNGLYQRELRHTDGSLFTI